MRLWGVSIGGFLMGNLLLALFMQFVAAPYLPKIPAFLVATLLGSAFGAFWMVWRIEVHTFHE